eukprot:249734-Rhodomonas_salina.3
MVEPCGSTRRLWQMSSTHLRGNVPFMSATASNTQEINNPVSVFCNTNAVSCVLGPGVVENGGRAAEVAL